jgi:hypothetical protein
MSAVIKSGSESWNSLLEAIARGEKLEDAMLSCRITRADIEMAVLQPLELQRYQDARLAGMKCAWPLLHREEICRRIAAGVSVDQAVVQVRGSEADIDQFYELVEGDGELHGRFLRAQRIKAMRDVEGLMAVANDTSRDVLDNGKGGQQGNMAAVTRDRLRVETKQKLLGIWHRELFGETKQQVNVQVNLNHAERLEECRERARTRGPTKRQIEAVDVPFSEIPVPNKAERPAPRRAAVEAAAPAAQAGETFGLDD